MKVEERFLNYISHCTTSNEASGTIPSSDSEFILAQILRLEMQSLGLTDIHMTEHCYVYGKLPATPGMEHYKAIGFISHMDTAPDFSGENIKPQMISDYDGKDVLLAESGNYLKVKDFPSLATLKGRTLITTDGTTLLGADDKAGIAEILTAIEEIITEQIPHGDLWIGFTPDEEIGCGADLFDLNIFQADYAYTVDGDYEGEVAYENFNAASATLSFIIRDHDKTQFENRLQKLRDITTSLNQKYGAETITLEIEHSYENMLSVIENQMEIVDLAKQAISAEGLTPLSRPIRGGTDGARLSFMGLPCPNLGTGGYGFHGPYEHISVEGMQTTVRILKYIAAHPVKKA